MMTTLGKGRQGASRDLKSYLISQRLKPSARAVGLRHRGQYHTIQAQVLLTTRAEDTEQHNKSMISTTSR